MKIEENYLYLNKEKEFNNRLLEHFHQRLQLFLCTKISKKDIPKVEFTKNPKILYKFYGSEPKDIMAFYDHETNTCVFNSSRYMLSKEEQKESGFKYKVPLSDCYHELVHNVQYLLTEYEYTDLLESSNEIFTYIMTGQSNICYEVESMALWHIAKYILKLNSTDFYLFIVSAILEDLFTYNYLLSSKQVLKILSKKYNNDIKQFYKQFKNDFYFEKERELFYKDLNKLHNLIFYRF